MFFKANPHGFCSANARLLTNKLHFSVQHTHNFTLLSKFYKGTENSSILGGIQLFFLSPFVDNFNNREKLQTVSPNKITSRFISSKSLPRTFSRPVKFPEDPYKLTELVNSLIQAQRLDDAIALMLNVTRRLGNPIVPWNVLLTEITNQLRLNLAFKLFNEMKCYGVKPNERTYTILLAGCSKSKAASASEKAEHLLKEMKRRSAPKEPEVEDFNKSSLSFEAKEVSNSDPTLSGPSLYHFNNLLKVYARSSKFEDMIQLYENMRLHHNKSLKGELPTGCAPDIISYTIVANTFSRMKTDEAFVQALNVLGDIRCDNALIQESNTNSPLIEIDAKFLEALVLGSRTCVDQEHLHKGLELIDHACGLNLDIDYPVSEVYKSFPTLTSTEIDLVSEVSKSSGLLDLALHLISRLGYHRLAWPIFKHFVNLNVTPDLLHFAAVTSELCHRAQQIFNNSDTVTNSKRYRRKSDARFSPSDDSPNSQKPRFTRSDKDSGYRFKNQNTYPDKRNNRPPSKYSNQGSFTESRGNGSSKRYSSQDTFSKARGSGPPKKYSNQGTFSKARNNLSPSK